MNVLSVIGNTALIYIALLIGLRLLGKKGLGQLTLTDVLFVMLLTEGAGDAMHKGDESLPVALISAFTLVVINKIFELLLYRFPRLRRIVDGVPVVLVRQGRPNEKEMRRNQVTIDEVEQAAREKGLAKISAIKIAILEVDGKVTILDDDDIETENPIKGLDDEDK